MFSSVFARVSDKRGTSFPTRKKCQELSVIFIVFMTSNSLLFFMFAVSCKRGRKFLWYPKKNERASNSVHLLTAANILKKIFLESLFLRSSTFKNPFCVCVLVWRKHTFIRKFLWRMPLKELSFVIKVCVPVSTVTLWILYSLCEIWS